MNKMKLLGSVAIIATVGVLGACSNKDLSVDGSPYDNCLSNLQDEVACKSLKKVVEKNANCNILSALFLKNNEHQEIKTRINHLAPNCRSYQRVKEVLSYQSKGVYQGKIYVKDIAQKTDAYQLSKALLLNDEAEFNSKPELEIYADDVKCSHGSTSGNVDEDAIHYLMTRGLKREEATKLLIKGFLSDVIEFIKSDSIRKFVQSILEKQVNGY